MNKSSGLIIDEKNMFVGNHKALIHDRLKRLFFTSINESIGSLNKGSYLPAMMHEMNRTSIAGEIIAEIELILNSYEPLIELRALEVKTEETNLYAGVIIKIDFYYPGTSIEDSITISKFN